MILSIDVQYSGQSLSQAMSDIVKSRLRSLKMIGSFNYSGDLGARFWLFLFKDTVQAGRMFNSYCFPYLTYQLVAWGDSGAGVGKRCHT